MRHPVAIIVISALAFVSCGDDTSSQNESGYSRLVSASARLLLLNQEARFHGWDSTYSRVRQDSLLELHGLTFGGLRRELEEMGTEGEHLRKFFSDVVRELEAIQQEQKAQP